MLLFKKKFLPAIRAGRKTQTIRLWKFCRMKAGQRSYIPGAGHIRIESVECVPLEDLTQEDARRDGFDTLAELRAEIDRIYPGGAPSGAGSAGAAKPYRVIFSLLPPEAQEHPQAGTRERT